MSSFSDNSDESEENLSSSSSWSSDDSESDEEMITVEECLKQLHPLHWACLKGASLETIKYLVEEADGDKGKELLGKADNNGNYPLHLACYGGALDVVKYLVEEADGDKGKELLGKAEDKNGRYPLHYACYGSASLDVVKYLVEEADGDKGKELLGKADKYGSYPLHWACWGGASLDVIKYLVEEADGDKGKELLGKADNDGLYPLHYACQKGASLEIIKYLVEEADGDKGKELLGKAGNGGMYPLHFACQNGASLAVIKYLVEEADGDKGKELLGKANNDGNYPLHYACEKGALDVIKYLVEEADGDKGKELLGKGINYDSYAGALPLHIAIDCDALVEVIRVLLETDSSAAEKTVRVYDEDMLPLHLAIDKTRSLDVVKALLDAYPQAVRKKMKDGRLPIEACAGNEASEDLIVALLKADMPLREDGTPVEHGGSWTACVKNETVVAAGAVSRILSPVSEGGGGFGVHIRALAAVCDAEGRIALNLASSGPRAAIYEYLLFSRRYELEDGAPEHRTPTAVVLRAQDLGEQDLVEQVDYGFIFDEADKDKNGKLDRQEISTLVVSKIGLDPGLFLKGPDESIKRDDFVGICKRQLGDGPRNVVIKLMQKKDQWERECNARKKCNLDPKYVVSALPNIPSETEFAEAVNRGDGGLDTIVKKFLDGVQPGKYAIVMDAADRNLHQIYYQEQPKLDAVRDMLRQVFEAVKHLHEKNLMHGDIKMLNIVRFRIDNQLRLIDLDASTKIVPIGGEDESFAGAKFSSAILPPEMIERIDTEEQLQEFNTYWEGENDEVLKEKVAPKLYMKQGVVKARYVVKSFRTEEGKPVYEGLPYDLVEASKNIDAWALGVLAFTLLTGETLIPSTRDDDCASGAAMHVLCSWGKQPDVLNDLFKRIHDKAARELVQQLLQREPEKRPTVASLLETHPFFHPERNDEEMKGYVRQMNDRLENVDNTLQSQAKQLEIMNASIDVIKKMGDESKAELFHTRHVLLKGIFEATEVITPTTFIVVNEELPSKSSEEDVNKILDIVAAEDGSGASFQTKHASVTLSADGAVINLEGDLKNHYDLGMKWVKCIESVAARVAAGEVGKGAFEIIKEGIEGLSVGEKMYLYLIDELTGEPVREEGWPIVIKKPKEVVPKLLPLMQVGMRAMSIFNGAAGVARMFGYPVPRVPKAWSEGAQESLELLKKESSVEQFGVVHAEVKKGTEEKKSVRGVSLRVFMDFMNENDPGLKDGGKSGHFAGLQRIGDPEDGTALWTRLTDPVDIADAFKKRANQRREEQRKHDEHIQKMSTVEVDTTAAAKEAASAVVAGNTCCKVETTAAAKEATTAVAAGSVCCTII